MRKVEFCLENGKVPVGNNLVEAGIAVDGGKIVSVSKKSSLPKAEETVDVKGSLILPGVVDPHVHFRDPGFTEKEDFYSGSKAAVAGGVTTVCDMPNTSPETKDREKFNEKKKLGEDKSLLDFGLHGMLTSNSGNSEELLERGAVSLKLYPEKCEESNVSKIRGEGNILTVHPEDPAFLSKIGQDGDVDDFLEARPKKAESSEIYKILSMVSNFQPHFCHVTNEKSIEIIGDAKRDRTVTCEVTPHHLLLDDNDFRKQGSHLKIYPPLRPERDRKKMIQALRAGLIDMVATDHAPHTKEEKEKDIPNASAGIAGIETSLPLLFTLATEGKLSLFRLIEAMCEYPARIFGLRNENGIQKGVLKPGADADITVLNQNKEWEIKGEKLHGKTKFTPFEGEKVKGKPELTLVRGKKVYEKGKIVGEKGHGKFIPRRK